MRKLHPHVEAVMAETGEGDPVCAVRAKASALVHEFVRAFGDEPPLDVEALASYRGLVLSPDPPRHSVDSEIAPEGGRVALRINRERPLVRQRFSIGHEVGHTLFPEYQLAVRCRKPAGRDWADPEDLLEYLCDVAASEILFPAPWFDQAVAQMDLCAEGVRDLATRFIASPEATIRRLIEVYKPPLAAVFCSWKLKPTETRRVRIDRHQARMLRDDPLAPEPKLRVDYALLNDEFKKRCCSHIPVDKSVPSEGAIAHASERREPGDAVMSLELGTIAGDFQAHTLPVYTAEDRIGPRGGGSVAVLIHPAE